MFLDENVTTCNYFDEKALLLFVDHPLSPNQNERSGSLQ